MAAQAQVRAASHRHWRRHGRHHRDLLDVHGHGHPDRDPVHSGESDRDAAFSDAYVSQTQAFVATVVYSDNTTAVVTVFGYPGARPMPRWW